ncbi:hypothetical protein H9Y04_44360 [Streptomyces sp. TRM66268-LWL]|uniref:Secreted protein n=1 Tax=Streptomyces polyasparticus TaxID=2767826 RepID=A0ABR7SYV6_9ACTN|nr:hypothetical protein [Streptomyces polyasparticus]MBC9719548.1 hypothetical protein [Streptomyces polyasparticus]
MRTRTGLLVTSIVILGSVALPTIAVASPALPMDPADPGCRATEFTANHTTGEVSWSIRCDQARDVIVDATAWHGDSSDHTWVSGQKEFRHVTAGDTWTASMTFPSDTVPSTDQISAQAVTFKDIGDPSERPAILGTVNG